MQFFQKTPIYLVVLALFLATGAEAETYKRITKVSDFRKVVTGKTLKSWTGKFRLGRNGTLAGKIERGSMAGAKVTGKWKWKKGQYCTDIALNGKPYSKKCKFVLYAKGAKKVLFMEKNASQGNVYEVR